MDKLIQQIYDKLCGTCNYFDISEFAETHNISEIDLALAMDDAEIFRCVNCGWWQYPGETCGAHDHDEIICNNCCEERNE